MTDISSWQMEWKNHQVTIWAHSLVLPLMSRLRHTFWTMQKNGQRELLLRESVRCKHFKRLPQPCCAHCKRVSSASVLTLHAEENRAYKLMRHPKQYASQYNYNLLARSSQKDTLVGFGITWTKRSLMNPDNAAMQQNKLIIRLIEAFGASRKDHII